VFKHPREPTCNEIYSLLFIGRTRSRAANASVALGACAQVFQLFELEAKMAWKASTASIGGSNDAAGLRHICELYGVAVTMPLTEDSGATVGSSSSSSGGGGGGGGGGGQGALPGLHMVMELLDAKGDIHDVIHDDARWVKVRDRGVDTGARLKKGLLMHDGHDVWM
jgi:hypothetical protein